MTARAGGDPGPGLTTPEAVPVGLPVADVGTRGLAYLIDVVLQVVLLGLVGLVIAVLATTTGAVPPWVGITVAILGLLAVSLGYPIVFETLWRGRTPGMAVLGLRVLTAEGGPVALRHAALRGVMEIVDFQVTAGAAAVITALVTDRRQRLGDVVAGTVVVRERSGAGTPEAVEFRPPPGHGALAGRLDVSGLQPADYVAVRQLLRRAADLPPATAERLAAQLARRLSGRLRPAPPDGVTALDYLRCVAAAVQSTGRPAGPPAASRAPATEAESGRRADGGFAPPG